MDIKTIISQMTLEEKASLCSGKNFWETKPIERLGVPSIMMTDGPHGMRKVYAGSDGHSSEPATCFPPAVLSACSFDTELMRELGEALGRECVAGNVRIILGPAVNIKRSPLCGRNFEYFSEDPLLAGEMAVAHIRGVQSTGVGTSIKHFAANSQETRRFSSDSQVDERTLREIYFPAFERAVKEAQPTTVMCSYNRLNGEYASEHPWLLTEVLRDEWGFDGLVVSDWGAVNDRVKGVAAGLELEMPGGRRFNDDKIAAAVRSGELDEAVLDLCIERILTLLERVKGDGQATPFDKEAHHALARRVAAESMVLLKNDGGLLPLKKDAKIAFIGEFALTPRYQGAGSSLVNPTALTSALKVAVAKYSKTPAHYDAESPEWHGAPPGPTEIIYARGYDTNNCDEPDDALVAEAVAVAKEADVCVLFIGLPPSYESEGFDREHMRIPGGQNALVEAIAAANENVVVVLHNGAPVEMPWVDKAPAILESHLGGQAGGAAVVDILFGEQNPCGKLAESFPKRLSDNPSYLNYFGEGDITQYREGVFVGYRYYDTKDMDILFPFGHGLSYTTFGYSNLKLGAGTIRDTDTLDVTVDVTNTGSVAGKEIVQVYVGAKNRDDHIIRPTKELRAFAKVSLEPGETKTVSFTLDKRAFAYYNAKLRDWHVLDGVYRVMACRSSRDIAAEAEVEVVSTVPIPVKADVNTPFCDIMRLPGGTEFVNELAYRSHKFSASGDDDPGPASWDHMFLKMIPEMVGRQIIMLNDVTMSIEELQEVLDERFGE
uniref:Beta-glucosidase n=1 Tax=uncultured bacterium contig00040 TaxID=1181528 RepID=A0A806KJ49_9BACT|nr:beta-glucosidase [uncultured bacterium contig00040]